jgi:hypothetical protein
MTARNKANNSPTAWWKTPPAGWEHAAASTYARWHKHHAGLSEADADVARKAMAFGYGSRAEYGALREWNDLDAQLESDWARAGRSTKRDWAHVRSAVRAGWKAAGTETPAPVEAAAPSADDTPTERLVAGGRLH